MLKNEILKLIEQKETQASKYKEEMETSKEISKSCTKYEINEFLNAECSISFNKGFYLAITREIIDLKELLKLVEKIEE